jgi:hypothetical protein
MKIIAEKINLGGIAIILRLAMAINEISPYSLRIKKCIVLHVKNKNYDAGFFFLRYSKNKLLDFMT